MTQATLCPLQGITLVITSRQIRTVESGLLTGKYQFTELQSFYLFTSCLFLMSYITIQVLVFFFSLYSFLCLYSCVNVPSRATFPPSVREGALVSASPEILFCLAFHQWTLKIIYVPALCFILRNWPRNRAKIMINFGEGRGNPYALTSLWHSAWHKRALAYLRLKFTGSSCTEVVTGLKMVTFVFVCMVLFHKVTDHCQRICPHGMSKKCLNNFAHQTIITWMA